MEMITYALLEKAEVTWGNCLCDSWNWKNRVGIGISYQVEKNKVLYTYIHTQEIRYILLYSICKILFHKRPMETSMTKYSCASSLQKMGHLYIYYFSLCALRLSCPISDLSYWVLFVCFMYTAVMLASKITAVSFLFQVTH